MAASSLQDSRGEKMKNFLFSFLALFFLFLAGCATVRGMGEDIQSLGKGIKKAVSQNDNDRDKRN